MSTPRTSLDQARTDLAAIEAELNVLLAAKSDASRSAAAFASWRADHDAKTAERDRLATRIENLELEVAIVEADEADQSLRKNHADRKAANEKLAQRIKSEIKKANSILMALIQDVALAAQEDAKINADLPDDLEPLMPADLLARGRPGLERQELNRTRVWLWINTRGGSLIGDQDAVVDRGDGRGRVGEGPYSVNCARALFEQVSYHPAEPAERPTPFWQQLRLPRPDGPGLEFDGSRCNFAADALAELARRAQATESRERPIEIEFRPVPALAADGVAA
jgi:hypothetical protein